VTPEAALKLAWELVASAFRIADMFGQRQALKAKMRAEMAAMFDEAEDALERKHGRERDTEPPGDA
jgi:hypothetical protein